MKIAVIGSRGFNDVQLLEVKLDTIKNLIIELISGGAQGADTLAEAWALANNIPIKLFKPDWKSMAGRQG
jgi:predicted Rossmann fold nucleotide-binding protein DprA/Smf involved in DNA uptake